MTSAVDLTVVYTFWPGVCSGIRPDLVAWQAVPPRRWEDRKYELLTQAVYRTILAKEGYEKLVTLISRL